MAGRIEQAFVFCALNVFMGAFLSLPEKISGEALQAGDQNVYNTIARAMVAAGVVALGAVRWRQMAATARHALLPGIFLLLALASAAWSIAPEITLRRVVALGIATAFACYAAAVLPMPALIRQLAAACVLSATASAVLALGLPGIGTMSGVEDPLGSLGLAGAWSGVYAHKSQLGLTMALGVLGCGWVALAERERRWRYAAGAVLCGAVAAMARSATAEVAILLLPVLVVAGLALRLPMRARLAALLVLGTAGLVALLGAGFLFGDAMALLGKDESLTGRGPLWAALLQLAAGQPLGGYGYGAFFTADNPDLAWVQSTIDWPAPEAHQGYIEVLLQLGLPGLALALLLLAGALRRALAGFLRGAPAWSGFAAAYLAVQAITNLVETTLLNPGDLHAMLLVLVAVALAQETAALAPAPRPRRPVPAMLRRPVSAPRPPD